MLLNKSALASQLGVDRRFVTAMCAKGFQLNLGGRTTIEEAIAWLRQQGTAFQGIQRQSKRRKKKTTA